MAIRPMSNHAPSHTNALSKCKGSGSGSYIVFSYATDTKNAPTPDITHDAHRHSRSRSHWRMESRFCEAGTGSRFFHGSPVLNAGPDEVYLRLGVIARTDGSCLDAEQGVGGGSSGGWNLG